MTAVQVDMQVAAAPAALYGLVSDVTRMGQWSPETTSCRWLKGAGGPALGARFKGVNHRGWRRWSTTCTVVAADPGRSFAFEVKFGPIPISRWAYDFSADGKGCQVTETWLDRRPSWMTWAYPIVMGVRDPGPHNRAGMQTTLSHLREAAENSSKLNRG